MDAEADREESWVREQMQQHPGLAEEARAPAPPPHRHTATPHLLPIAPPPHIKHHASSLCACSCSCAHARQDARALYECSESPDHYAMDVGG